MEEDKRLRKSVYHYIFRLYLTTISFRTKNAQGIATEGKEGFRELKTTDLDICELTETKKNGCCIEVKDDHTLINSGITDKRVAIAINKSYRMFVKDWEYVTERIMKIQKSIFNRDMVTIAFYVQTDYSSPEVKNEFEDTLVKVLSNITIRKK